MLSWYEENLPLRERKTRGHFSTPPQLVEQILDACGYCPTNNLTRLRVLDPACGSGNFLAGAARRLVASSQRAGLGAKEQLRLVQRNLWGFDPDPVACFLAEMQLRTVLSQQSLVPSRLSASFPLHVHQSDGLALSWDESECVDLLLANPPYLAAKNTDLSGYRSTHRRGQADSYLLFLDLALRVVRPGGWIGLVLPDSLLARANAARERERLLREMTVQQLWHLSGVFTAYVGAVVIIARKQSPPCQHHIAWKRARWGRDTDEASSSIAQNLLLSQPGAELRYLLSCVRESLVPHLYLYLQERPLPSNAFVPLEQLVMIRRGEELAKDALSLNGQCQEDGRSWYPVLRGGVDVRPYTVPQARYWMVLSDIVKPLQRYLMPKLLVVKSTGSLQATLDLQGHIVLQTLYLLIPRHESLDELYFLLALLNSRLLQEYIYALYTAYKWVQPQIEQSVLARLPVPILASPLRRQISDRARVLMHACSQLSPVVELNEIHELYEQQERAIGALYHAALQPITNT